MDQIVSIFFEDSKYLVLRELLTGEMEVMKLVEKVNVLSQPKVSLILKEFRDLNIVSVKIDGKKRIYKINAERINLYKNEIIKKLSGIGNQFDDEIIIRR
jgi:DNA-binding transcriptional ArsR family regulator